MDYLLTHAKTKANCRWAGEQRRKEKHTPNFAYVC